MPDFYTFFLVPDALEPGINLQKSAKARIAVYLRCIHNEAKMMARNGDHMRLMTNNREGLLASDPCAADLDIIEVTFEMSVPRGISFYSSHFKIEIIKHVGSGAFGDFPVLIDPDMLALKSLPAGLLQGDGVLLYDITPWKVADAGHDRLLKDLNTLVDPPLDKVRWFGGEFIAASAETFAALSREIDKIWPTYVGNIDSYSHVGNETIVTAALLNLEHRGVPLIDVGAQGVVQRWWTARTMFPQPRLRDVSDVCFLHLPADKEFLSALDGPAAPQALEALRAYARPELLKRRLANPFLNLRRGERKYVARV